MQGVLFIGGSIPIKLSDAVTIYGSRQYVANQSYMLFNDVKERSCSDTTESGGDGDIKDQFVSHPFFIEGILVY